MKCKLIRVNYSCSIASSSGVSSSSGTGTKRTQGIPGPIDNSNLVADPSYKVGTLTGEGNAYGLSIFRGCVP